MNFLDMCIYHHYHVLIHLQYYLNIYHHLNISFYLNKINCFKIYLYIQYLYFVLLIILYLSFYLFTIILNMYQQVLHKYQFHVFDHQPIYLNNNDYFDYINIYLYHFSYHFSINLNILLIYYHNHQFLIKYHDHVVCHFEKDQYIHIFI